MNNDKFSWIHAFTDAALAPTTKLVLHTICMFMNSRGEGAFPAMETIAEKSGLGITAVKKHITLAATAGWLKTGKHGFGGRGWARNEYHVAYPQNIGLADDGPDDQQKEHIENTENKVGREATNAINKVGHLSQEGGSPRDLGVGREATTNIPINKSNNIKPPKSPLSEFSEESEFEQAFEQMWNIYPNQQDRRAALSAYLLARGKASHRWIMVGVQHYASNCKKNQQSPKLLKNWLGGDGWRDVAEPGIRTMCGPPGFAGAIPDASAKNAEGWQKTKARMVTTYGQPVVNSWFEELAIADGPENGMILIAKTKFIAGRIRTDYFYALGLAFKASGGGALALMTLSEFIARQGEKN